MSNEKGKKKAVVIGGSIAGVSSAHALISAGWEVVVLEKSVAPPQGSPTGAGVGLDPQSQRVIESWIAHPHLLQDLTFPMQIELHQAVIDGEKRVLTRDENFNFRNIHWADLHGLLYTALPPEIFLWGHLFLSFEVSQDKTSVKAMAKVLQTDEIVEINGDLLVGADGSLSSIRRALLPDLKLRYTGYCAWRGVLNFVGLEDSETIIGIRRGYRELGNALYFDLVAGSHAVLFELPSKRLNWLYYVHKPEPALKGNSVTMKVSDEMIREMYEEAEKNWVPELVRVMKDTKEPFINFIYDCDPPEKFFWDNVVLLGDAAHPSTPHCTRSTNMTIADAAVLGKCLEKYGAENLASALEEYQRIRQPVASKQVLHSRRVGRIRQGLSLTDRVPFDPNTTSLEDCQELQHMHMPFFDGVPFD